MKFYKGPKEKYTGTGNQKDAIYFTTDTNQIITDSGTVGVEPKELEEIHSFIESSRATGNSTLADGGDIPIMPLYRGANVLYTKVTEELKDTPFAIYVTSYNKPYIGKPFNRIKMMLGTPGRCRISIVNEHVFDANPTYDTFFVKDLVNVQCTSTGYHVWDLDEDVVIGENEFIGAWYTQDCARYTYTNNLTYQTAYPSGWYGRYNGSNEVSKEVREGNWSAGYLNIGLYQRGNQSDFSWGKLDEGVSSKSTASNAYYPCGQEKLVGKTIYKLRMNVQQVGYLTINLLDNYGKANATVIKSWKLYVRQLGVQTIRLPENIVLQEGQGIGVHAEGDTCLFTHSGQPFGTKYSLIGWYQYNSFNYQSEPTVVNNGKTLNIELIERGSKISSLEDKTISIQGDSISTFAGTITDGNASYYSTSHKFVNTKDATWWGLLVNECRMHLIRNDAWSGSRVSGSDNKAMCSTARCANLKNAVSTQDKYQFGSPEIIAIMCGTNDLGGNVELGTINDTGTDTYCGAFKQMLSNIKNNCPFAKIVVCQLYRGNSEDYKNSNGTHQYEYQEMMEKLCRIYGAYYVGPERFGIQHPSIGYYTCDNTLSDYGVPTYTGCDYLHPNMQGMERIYAGIRTFLESLY